MKKQMKWGLATLILLLGIAAVFLFIDQNAELQQLEKETAESDKLRQEHNKPQETLGAVEELPPVVPPNEHPSGPHQRENGTVHNPSVSQVAQTYTGPLTYHEELLKTNPVKALRLQAEERGHWSAKWIPPFPPDDLEAAAIARDIYLITYYESIGDTTNPICLKALRNRSERRKADFAKQDELWERGDTLTYKDRVPPSEAYKQYKWESARMADLGKLGWSRLTVENVFYPKRRSSNFPIPK